VIADEKESLLGLTRGLAPVIASGNTAVLIASERLPLSAISLAEVMATSDLPAGVVNILTGSKSELIPWLASHMEVDGIDISGADKKLDGEIKRAGAENLKRIYRFEKDASLKRILSFMEYKTVWHPIGI
jgi:acyl-CoA reductase-like NAD-dependent aldehyde dehydrogenase